MFIKNKSLLSLCITFLSAYLAPVSYALVPTAESIEQGVEYAADAENYVEILLPLHDYRACIDSVYDKEKDAASVCAEKSGVKRAWQFITEELDFLYSIEIPNNADFEGEPLTLIPVDFHEQLYRSLHNRYPVQYEDNNVFPVAMDELTEVRIRALEKDYQAVRDFEDQYDPVFVVGVYVLGEKERLAVPLSVEGMITIALKHQEAKKRQSRCSLVPIDPVSKATLGDLYNVNLYLKQQGIPGSDFSFPDIRVKNYDPAACCLSFGDAFECWKKTAGKHIFSAPDIYREDRPASFIFQRVLGPSYIDAAMSAFIRALLQAGNEAEIVNAVADYTRLFLLVHPYKDGNGRIFRMLANYVLMLYGMPPLAFDSFMPVPYTHMEWREIVRQAQEKARLLLTGPGA